MDAFSVMTLILACAPLINPATARALVAVESGFNADAIGVVGGSLDHQPRARNVALSTAWALQRQGWDFSVGLAQINVRNFKRLGLTASSAFDPCANLAAMQILLLDCFTRASMTQPASSQLSLRRALSCYYSGNFVTGFIDGYVHRVVLASRPSTRRPMSALRSTKEST